MAYIQDTFSNIISLALIGVGLFIFGALLQEPVANGVESISVPVLSGIASAVKFLIFTPGWGTVITLALVGIVTLTFKIKL